MRSLIKSLVWGSGLLRLLHRLRNHGALTTVMFHRVLPEGDPRLPFAEPSYVVTDRVFDGCLRFFRQNYNVIGADDLRHFMRSRAPLPPRSLLITFDDGWADNLSVAAPILKRHGLGAIVFVASEPIYEPGDIWWQDLLVYGFQNKLLESIPPTGDDGETARASDIDRADFYRLLRAAHAMTPAAREDWLAEIVKDRRFAPPRQMLTIAELGRLSANGLEIGAHGASHLPLTMVGDQVSELAEARRQIQEALEGEPGGAAVDLLSAPHGQYNFASVAAAGKAGFVALFTSDACLTRTNTPQEPGEVSLFGRIYVDMANASDGAGQFSAERLGYWLFTRKIGDPGASARQSPRT